MRIIVLAPADILYITYIYIIYIYMIMYADGSSLVNFHIHRGFYIAIDVLAQADGWGPLLCPFRDKRKLQQLSPRRCPHLGIPNAICTPGFHVGKPGVVAPGKGYWIFGRPEAGNGLCFSTGFLPWCSLKKKKRLCNFTGIQTRRAPTRAPHRFPSSQAVLRAFPLTPQSYASMDLK